MIKETFFKTVIINKNEHGLEIAEGYRQTYTDPTGWKLFLFFENQGGTWNITEKETGATIGNNYKTLKEAQAEAPKKIEIIRKIWNEPHIRQMRRIKFDLLCNYCT